MKKLWKDSVQYIAKLATQGLIVMHDIFYRGCYGPGNAFQNIPQRLNIEYLLYTKTDIVLD